jgi:hypothetical protein
MGRVYKAGVRSCAMPEDRRRRVEHGVGSWCGPYKQSERPRAAEKFTCVDVPEPNFRTPMRCVGGGQGPEGGAAAASDGRGLVMPVSTRGKIGMFGVQAVGTTSRGREVYQICKTSKRASFSALSYLGVDNTQQYTRSTPHADFSAVHDC